LGPNARGENPKVDGVHACVRANVKVVADGALL